VPYRVRGSHVLHKPLEREGARRRSFNTAKLIKIATVLFREPLPFCNPLSLVTEQSHVEKKREKFLNVSFIISPQKEKKEGIDTGEVDDNNKVEWNS
jgi:hypothetical protein